MRESVGARRAARERRGSAARGAARAEVALAGGVAGVIAETTMHPLDTVSHRAKVHPASAYGTMAGAARQIVREEGLYGLLRGWHVTALLSAPSSMVYFGMYHTLRKWLLPMARSRTEENFVFFLSGAIAEFHSTILFVPLDVARSRIQLGQNPSRATGGAVQRTVPYNTLRETLLDIVRTDGLRGLWAGGSTVVLQECTFSACQFVLYENIRRAILTSSLLRNWGVVGAPSSARGVSTRRAEHELALGFVSGALAGSLAAFLTNPLDTATSRMQTQGSARRFGRNAWTVLRTAAKEGVFGLWRGALPRATSCGLLSAVQFSLFETIRVHVLGHRSLH